jgi:hypothetical protein
MLALWSLVAMIIGGFVLTILELGSSLLGRGQ